MKKILGASVILTLGLTGVASAQTASPSNRDTTVQTGGPSGTSGAVGPNDNPDGSDKDGTRPSTPPAIQAAKAAHHHHRRTSKPAATPQPGGG